MFDDRDSGVRVNAFIALARMRGDKSQAVPALIAALSSTPIQRLAATALGQIGPPAAAAVPDLIRLLNAEDAYTREQATIAVWQITGDKKYLSLLIREFQDADDAPTIDSLLAEFGELGAGAVPLLPAIRDKLKGRGVNATLLETIGKIDPEAAYRFR